MKRVSDYLLIESLEDLKEYLKDGECHEFFIWLGICRSSKAMTYDGDDCFWVLNEIDNTEEQLTTAELIESNIGIAIKNGRFYAYGL